MPEQARVGDVTQGHWSGVLYFPPVVLTEGSPDTFSSGPACSRVGDAAESHRGYLYGVVPTAISHTPKASTGSSNTFINGKQAFRAGDSFDCGDTQVGGNPAHLVGG